MPETGRQQMENTAQKLRRNGKQDPFRVLHGRCQVRGGGDGRVKCYPGQEKRVLVALVNIRCHMRIARPKSGRRTGALRHDREGGSPRAAADNR